MIYIDDNSGIVTRLVYHFIHNFTTTFMSLPDSFRYDDLIHLSQRTYWIDNNGWQGNLPVVQTILIFLNILLVVIGLGFAWVHHRWAGMLPMVVFVAYTFSLTVALNSGGRYIVPINWVIYFYYGLAIVAIIQFVDKVISGKIRTQPIHSDPIVDPGLSDRRKFWFSLAGIVFLASLIPLANYALPLMTKSARNHIDVKLEQSVSALGPPGASFVDGTILYPYYANDILTFTLFTDAGYTDVQIASPQQNMLELTSQENALVVLQGQDPDNLKLELIYVWQNNSPLRLWDVSRDSSDQ